MLCVVCGRQYEKVTHFDSATVQRVDVLLIQHVLVLWLDTLTGDLPVVEKLGEGLRGHDTLTNSPNVLPIGEIQLVVAEKAIQPYLGSHKVPLDPRCLG